MKDINSHSAKKVLLFHGIKSDISEEFNFFIEQCHKPEAELVEIQYELIELIKFIKNFELTQLQMNTLIETYKNLNFPHDFYIYWFIWEIVSESKANYFLPVVELAFSRNHSEEINQAMFYLTTRDELNISDELSKKIDDYFTYIKEESYGTILNYAKYYLKQEKNETVNKIIHANIEKLLLELSPETLTDEQYSYSNFLTTRVFVFFDLDENITFDDSISLKLLLIDTKHTPENDKIKTKVLSKINPVKIEDYDWINWILEQFYTFKYPMKAIDFIAYFLHGRKQQLVDINTELLYKLLIMFVSNENNETLNHHDTEEVILFLQQNHLNIENLKTLEWLYSGLDRVDPENIEKEIMNNPKFFVELISMIYKPKNSKNEIDDYDKNLTKEQIVNRATTAYNVLEKITCIPGTNGDEIDINILKDWISKTISYFKDVDRESIGNSKIGKLLSYAPAGDDKIWPHKAIREVFEEFRNNEIESGFQIGKSNQRGVTTRAYDEGGEQEYSLAESYYVNAKKIELIYPQTAHILKKMGDNYLHQAKREDERNEIM